MPPTIILVTGASGLIGCHCVPDLLNHCFQVREPVRNIGRTDALEATPNADGADTNNPDWVEAALTEPNNWLARVDGCEAIFHVALQAPTIQPKNPADASRWFSLIQGNLGNTYLRLHGP